MATVIVITNQKGGVGKTTTVAAIGSSLGMLNKRVLLIDMDPQGSLSFSFGAQIIENRTIYEVLKEDIPAKDAIQHSKYFDIIPSDILLSRSEVEFSGSGFEKILKKSLRPLQRLYDYIIIDTPPALNILTVNAYTAANYLIIPMAADILSLLGLSQLQDTVDAVKASYNPNLHVLGILMTKVQSNTRLSAEVREMAEALASQMNTRVFQNQIRNSIAIAEAPAHGTSIFEYDAKSNAAQDYLSFIEEIAKDISLSEN